MASRKCASRKCGLIFLVIGVILLLLSIIFLAIFPTIYTHQFHGSLTLTEGTLMYDLWKDVPLPIYQNLYFFNITNAEEFRRGREKLNVTELGPYVYRSRFVKEDIMWYPNKTIGYRERRTYIFDEELSAGTEADEVVTLNGPLIIAADHIKDWILPARAAAGAALEIAGEDLVTRKTIRQLVYEGYADTIIKYGKYVQPDLPYKDGLFSWLYGKNDTDDGSYTVFTGEDGLGNLNIIDNWNGSPNLSFWKNESCNAISGSNGEVSPPLKDGQKELTFFQSFICRPMTFSYTQDVKHMGLTGKRFSITKMVFGNETVNPDNACYDTRPYLPSGVQDLGACQFNVPVILSLPHFYLADPWYLQSMEGVDPKQSLHMSYIDVMSEVGFGMETAIRMQINLFVRRDIAMPQLYGIQDGVYPIFWMEISVKLTKEFGDYILGKIENPKKIAYSITGVMMGLAVIFVITGVIIILFSRKQRKDPCDDDPLLGSKPEEIKRYSTISENSSQNKAFVNKNTDSPNDVRTTKGLFHTSDHNGEAVSPTGSVNQNNDMHDVSLPDTEPLIP